MSSTVADLYDPADVALTTGELAPLIAELIDALGGQAATDA